MATDKMYFTSKLMTYGMFVGYVKPVRVMRKWWNPRPDYFLVIDSVGNAVCTVNSLREAFVALKKYYATLHSAA